MIQEFHIDNYYDGYRTNEINCIDLPIGAAAGHFNRDYYFYYCMCYAVLLNWSRYFKEDWYETRKAILQILDLEFCKVPVADEMELENKIQQCFANGTPIVLIVKYGALFYSKYYGYGTYDHGLLISDYNDETKLYGIRDRELVREHIDNGIFQSDVMHRLPIKFEQLKTIWLESQKLLREESSNHCNTFYCIKAKEKREDLTFHQVLKRLFYLGGHKQENQLERYLYESIENQTYNRVVEKFEIEKVRRIFYRSFYIMQKVMNQYTTEEEMGTEESQKLHQIINEIIHARTEILNQVQVYSVRKMIMEKEKVQQMMESDNQLFEKMKILIEDLIG